MYGLWAVIVHKPQGYGTMMVRSPCDVSTIFRRVYIGFHQPFVSFQYLSSDDVYNTTTQTDSIANGVKREPEEGAGAHRSAGCF